MKRRSPPSKTRPRPPGFRALRFLVPLAWAPLAALAAVADVPAVPVSPAPPASPASPDAPDAPATPARDDATASVAAYATERIQDAETIASLSAEGRALLSRDPIALPPYSYCSLSVAAAERGDFRDSIEAASRALVLAETNGNADLNALAKRDLALAYSYAGALDDALRYADDALLTRPNDPAAVFAPAYKVRGDVALRRHDPVGAEQAYRRALAIAHPSFRVFLLFSLANAQIASHDVAGARETFAAIAQAPASLRPLRERTEGNLLLAENQPQRAAAIFQASLDHSRGDDAAYDVLWARDGIARAALARGDRKAALDAYVAATRDAEAIRARFRSEEFKTGLFGDVQNIYEQAITLALAEHDAGLAWQLSERSRARALLDVVSDRAGAEIDPRALTGSPGDLAALQRTLRADVTLVEFHSLERTLVAWIITRDAITSREMPLPREQLALAVDDLRGAIVRRDPVANRYAERLGQLLVAPLGLPRHARLIIVPHGALHYLPFQALRANGRYLVEDHPIALEPSASIAVQLAQRPPRIAERLTAFGNPLIAPQYALPGAESEVTGIATLFPDRRLFLQQHATRANFTEAAQSAQILHVATHAQADVVDPLHSKILLSPTLRPTNVPDALLAADIYGMNLRAVALVTLSACETGLGRIARGDEIMGFNRAFLYAGASALLESMWPVSDDSTSAGMRVLYARLTAGDAAIDALRAAQLAVLRQPGFEHPFFWAPFNLLGDWRLAITRHQGAAS